MKLDPVVRSYYDKGEEAERLSSSRGRLEFDRTQELIQRFLPKGGLDVLDIGGAAGRYALWLSAVGHRVLLEDPVPLHVEQARAAGVNAQLGDARDLKHEDDSFDAVLMLGPLYHLQHRRERVLALGEARRVLRPGGVVFAAAIDRHAALLDLSINHDRLHRPGVFEAVERSVTTGHFDDRELFTTAYFHQPAELDHELQEAGLEGVRVLHIEAFGFLVPEVGERLDDPVHREVLLNAIRLVEEDMTTPGSHLLGVGSAK